MKYTEWHLEQQAYIITSSIMELFDSIDDYGPKYPDPVIIQTTYATVKDLLSGNIEDVMDSVKNVIEDDEDGDYNEIHKMAAEIIEDLEEYANMYNEVHNEH